METPSVDPACREKLVRLALGLGHGEADAEDLVQDCLLALYQGGFRGESSVSTWLYRVLLNKHYDQVRRRHRPMPPTPALQAAPGIAREAFERVHRALRELPEPQQALLAFRYFEELPYAEIADILGRPENTLRADCCRALESLHEVLSRTYGSATVKEWL